MTQINLPNRNITGDNLWSQVEDNDDAIVDVVNGAIDNGNIATGADINASKLLDGSITAAKLGTDSVTTAKIGNLQVTGDKIANSTIPASKLSGIRTYAAKSARSVAGRGDQSFAAVNNVAPGTYIACGHIATTSVNRVANLRITVDAGTGTVEDTALSLSGCAPTAFSNSSIVVVTATATIALRGEPGSGQFMGSRTLFGLG